MRNLSKKLNLESLAQLSDHVLERIENDSFSIAVVGEFERGENTFVNALLGQEILPSDVLPCSAILNSGLNDDESMSKLTLSVLPHVDAAIMVILAQSPFLKVERGFLENKLLTNGLSRVIFVVTGIDRCNRSEDADRVVQLAKERIENHILHRVEQQFDRESEEYKVYQQKIGKLQFGLSSYQALQAKLSKNAALLAQSRFPTFELALEKFLTQERGIILLQVSLNRAIASATEILKTISVQESASQRKREESGATYEAAVAEIAARQQEKTEEAKHIDATVEKLKQRLQPLLNHLEDELRQAAWEVINSTQLNSSDFNDSNLAVSMLRLDQSVFNGVESASRKLAGKIQTEIRRSLSEGVIQSKPISENLHQLLNSIGMQFIDIVNRTKFSITQGKIALKVRYRAKSNLGGWLSRNLSSDEFKQTFKAKYKQTILEEVDKQLKLNLINQKVSSCISVALDVLKQKIQQKGNSLLDNTKNILAELRDKRDRDEIQIEIEHQKLSEICAETQKILSNAQGLSE